MSFEFATSGKVIFGTGSTNQLPELLEMYGPRGVIYIGKHLLDTSSFQELIAKVNYRTRIQTITGEPNDYEVDQEVGKCQEEIVDFVVSIGGGSVIDFGKAVSILVANGGKVLDYIEVIGKGDVFTKPAVPFIAIPTTAGTGSEVTRNAVIKIPEFQTKASLRHVYMLPAVAIVDPLWTVSVPPAITATTGFDAITQVIEPFISGKSNVMIDSLCKEAILIGLENLPNCFNDPQNLPAREKMAYVSLIGGIALANAGLGAVHAFAAAIGGRYDISHGEICAALLPAVLHQNIESLKKNDKHHPVLAKIRWLDKQLNKSDSSEELLVRVLTTMQKKLSIKNLKELGIKSEEFDLIATKAMKASSMKGNPIPLEHDEMIEILKNCFM